MAHCQFSIIPILTFSCFCFNEVAGKDKLPTVSYFLRSPQPGNKFYFKSCYNEILNVSSLSSRTGVLNSTSLPLGSRRRRALGPRFGLDRASCEIHEASYLWNQPAGARMFLKVRLTHNNGYATYGLDSFHAISGNHLGKSYSVSTGYKDTTRNSYVAIVNISKTKPLAVTVLLGDEFHHSLLVVAGEKLKDGATIKVPPKATAYVISKGQRLDGLRLKSTKNFAVLSGSVRDVGTVVSHLVEMFPPECVFSTEYVVPFVTRWFSDAVICVQSLSSLPNMTATIKVLRNYLMSYARSLRRRGSYCWVAQRDVAIVTAPGPVMVIQYSTMSSDVSPASMTIIPPVTEWTRSVVLYPLKTSGSKQDNTTHFAAVTIKTSHANDLRVRKLGVGDVTRSLTMTQVGSSDYSQGYIQMIQADRYLLDHPSAGFQVIQYGWERESRRLVYASPVAFNFTGCDSPVPNSLPLVSLNDWHRDDNSPEGSENTDAGDKDDTTFGAVLGRAFGVMCIGVVTVGLIYYILSWRRNKRRSQTEINKSSKTSTIEATSIAESTDQKVEVTEDDTGTTSPTGTSVDDVRHLNR